MILATERFVSPSRTRTEPPRPRRRLRASAVVLAVGLIALGAGCARLGDLRSRHQHQPPHLPMGSDAPESSPWGAPPARDARGPDGGPARPQARSARPSQDAEVTFRSTAPPPLDATPAHRSPRAHDPSTPSPVTLQPPVALAPEIAQTPPRTAEGGRPVPRQARPRSDEPAGGGAASDRKTPDDGADPDPTPTLAHLVAAAQDRLAALDNYQVDLQRQERVGELLLPVEDVVLSIRHDPHKAVRIEWPDGPSKGREAIYSAGSDDGMMHVRMPGALVPRVKLPPENPMVLRNARYPITEAGFDTIVARLRTTLERHQNGDPAVGLLRYDGLETPPDLGRACHKLVQVRPDGETWVVLLDAETALPAKVEATTAQGTLLERYLFRNLRTNLPELAKADAFDPDARWGKTSLPRLARNLGLDQLALPVPEPEKTPDTSN